MTAINPAPRDLNYIPGLVAADELTGDAFAVQGNSADGSINVNVVSGGGGGTQYTDGAVAPTHPSGPTLEFNNGGTWATVGSANPLPVSASFTPSGTQDVNITKVAGSAVAQGHGTAATALRVELPTDGTGVIASISTSLTPGTAATNLGKAEDAAHSSGDTGVMALGVANEALTNISGTDGDYTPLGTDRNGTVHVAQKASTATLSNVAGSATTVTLLSANTARIGAMITNDSSAVLYVKFGTTASLTSYTVTLAGAASAPFSYYEVPAGYNGRIDGIWASAAGNARVTEVTP